MEDKTGKSLGNDRPAKKKKALSRFDIAMICAFIGIIGIVICIAAVGRKKLDPRWIMDQKTGEPLITGADSIFPKVAVNGEIYWRYNWGMDDGPIKKTEWKSTGGLKELPEGSVYYGEIKHVPGNKPTDDCEYVAVASQSGEIYVVPDDPDLCFVCSKNIYGKEIITPFVLEKGPIYQFSGDKFE